MTAEEIEQSNKYNAKHYEPFEENEDIEFYFEPECFEEWLEKTDSNLNPQTETLKSWGCTADEKYVKTIKKNRRRNKNMNFQFLFEQSGTFKNVFKGFGHKCYDYDILNEYNETDFVVDLFKEIEEEYDNIVNQKNEKTIFSNMTKENDFIIAFFPCTHFCDANSLQYRLLIGGKKRELNNIAVERLIKRNQDRARFFEIYLKFCFVCKTKGIRTIIENPASGGGNNYLEVFSPIDIAYKEKNRALFGDDFKKPTNYFAINFDMVEKPQMFFDDNIGNTKNIYDISSKSVSTGGRSIITKTYAKNFYTRFIEDKI